MPLFYPLPRHYLKNSLEIPVVWMNGETAVPTVRMAGGIDTYTTVYGTVDGKTPIF